MNNFKYLLTLFLSLVLISCGGNTEKQKSKAKKAQEEIYDYRDEQYQDFYSKYMRAIYPYDPDRALALVTNLSKVRDLVFKPEEIKEKLGLQSIPDGYGRGNMYFYRIAPSETGSVINSMKTRDEILQFYNRDGEKYMPCLEEYQEDNLFCLQSIQFPHHTQNYFYLPKESNKIDHIDQPISFYCGPLNDKKSCNLTSWPNYPYNLKISMYFTHPQNFFYIMPFVEQHFYEATGEHIWQNPVPKNMP